MTALALGVGMAGGGSLSFSLEESGSTPETYYTFFYIFSFFFLFIHLFIHFIFNFLHGGGGGSAKGISLKVIKERSLVLRMAVIYPQFALIYFEKHFLWVDSATLIFAGHLSSLGPC